MWVLLLVLPNLAVKKWQRSVLVVLSHLYIHQYLAPGFAQTKILTLAGILGEGDRYEILKLEHRFPEIRELCPSQVVLLLCSLWQPFCSCFAISTSSLPSILPLGGMTFIL